MKDFPMQKTQQAVERTAKKMPFAMNCTCSFGHWHNSQLGLVTKKKCIKTPISSSSPRVTEFEVKKNKNKIRVEMFHILSQLRLDKKRLWFK